MCECVYVAYECVCVCECALCVCEHTNESLEGSIIAKIINSTYIANRSVTADKRQSIFRTRI